MKAAEAAFKNSVDVWEGGTDTESGAALRAAGAVRNRCTTPVDPILLQRNSDCKPSLEPFATADS